MSEQPTALRLADYLTDRNRLDLTCDEAVAELRRLHQHELASNLWHEKTQWVQQTAQPGELGMHRADVLKQRIDRLGETIQELLKVLKDLEQEFGYMGDGWSDPSWDCARIAICKAEEL